MNRMIRRRRHPAIQIHLLRFYIYLVWKDPVNPHGLLRQVPLRMRSEHPHGRFK